LNKKLVSSGFIIFFTYIILSLVIGERHPFTPVPMYNHFPNWAYVFYAKDNDGRILFSKTTFRNACSPSDVSNLYSSYCYEKNWMYGFGKETPENLHEVGEVLLNHYKNNFLPGYQPKPDTLYIIRKHLRVVQGKFTETDSIIAYEAL
jgi:hypothetical protein